MERRKFNRDTVVLTSKDYPLTVRFIGRPFHVGERYATNVIDRANGEIKLLESNFHLLQNVQQMMRSPDSKTRCFGCDQDWPNDYSYCPRCGDDLVVEPPLIDVSDKDYGHDFEISDEGVVKLPQTPFTDKEIDKIKEEFIDLGSWGRFILDNTRCDL